MILIFLSQISRAYDPVQKPVPDMNDLHLPNRIDTAIFVKSCFLQDSFQCFPHFEFEIFG